MIRKKHLRMLRALAWKYHRRSGVDLEELNSEAILAYYEAMTSYRPGLSAITTWTYRCVSNHLLLFCQREAQQHALPLDETFYNAYCTPPPFFEAYDSLSDTSRQIVDLVTARPWNYLMSTCQLSTRMVTADLMRRKLWPQAFIRQAIKNLKKELNFI